MSGSSLRASNSGITGPPGIPKIESIPACFSPANVASTPRIHNPQFVAIVSKSVP